MNREQGTGQTAEPIRTEVGKKGEHASERVSLSSQAFFCLFHSYLPPSTPFPCSLLPLSPSIPLSPGGNMSIRLRRREGERGWAIMRRAGPFSAMLSLSLLRGRRRNGRCRLVSIRNAGRPTDRRGWLVGWLCTGGGTWRARGLKKGDNGGLRTTDGRTSRKPRSAPTGRRDR